GRRPAFVKSCVAARFCNDNFPSSRAVHFLQPKRRGIMRDSTRELMSGISRRNFVKGAAAAVPLALAASALGQQPGDRFDVVVAGGGHNSLITAAYLAKAGCRCLVLEGRPTVGGGVKT